jgi:hypothetical protein
VQNVTLGRKCIELYNLRGKTRMTKIIKQEFVRVCSNAESCCEPVSNLNRAGARLGL